MLVAIAAGLPSNIMRKTIEQLEAERGDLRVEANLNSQALDEERDNWRRLQTNRRRIEIRFAEIAAIIADREEEN